MMTNETSGENTYIVDAESPAEMARLMSLDLMTTQAMGGPFAALPDPSHLHNILDLGCGPGGWVLDVAFALPEAEVEGVDVSRIMVDYANARARTQHLPNASFGVMNITQPLDFPDASFDLVNARFLASVLPRECWTPFIAECTRVLRPGGTLRLTELIDAGVSSSPALEAIHSLLYHALWKAGYGFSADGKTLGITHVLPGLLRTAGYEHLRSLGHVLEGSADTDAWMDFYRNGEIAYKLVQPFLIQAGITTQEELDQLYQHLLIEMHLTAFRSMLHFMTIVGSKPSASDTPLPESRRPITRTRENHNQ